MAAAEDAEVVAEAAEEAEEDEEEADVVVGLRADK